MKSEDDNKLMMSNSESRVISRCVKYVLDAKIPENGLQTVRRRKFPKANTSVDILDQNREMLKLKTYPYFLYHIFAMNFLCDIFFKTFYTYISTMTNLLSFFSCLQVSFGDRMPCLMLWVKK